MNFHEIISQKGLFYLIEKHKLILESNAENNQYLSNENYQNSLINPNELEEIFENKENFIDLSINSDIKTNQNDLANEKIGESEYSYWKLEIPKINLVAPIEEGVSEDVMNRSIGHFPKTSKDNGNIGLAAHNRGYKVNYFKNLRELKKNDEIIYTYNGNRKKYLVNKIEIIQDTDWTNLENTNESKITLITCVENRANLRRLIQGTLKD